jgi:AcrR family transcriptional regulator
MDKKKKRVKEILRAAELMFLMKGFNNSSMDEIADLANLGKGTIYYYFRSKDEIFLSIIKREADKVYEEIVKRVSKEKSLYEIVKEIISFYLEYFSKNQTFLRLFFPCIEGLIKIEKKELLKEYTKSYRKHLKFIKTIISKKIEEERKTFSLKSLLNLINVFQIGIGLKLLEGKEKEAKESLRLFLKIIKKFLEG